MSKIIKLTSENVKRLQAVEISPDGNVIVIGGRNGQGKSSVLDSIQYALGGDPSDKMPVRRGEEKAKVVVDLGDIIVRRTFTAAGGTALVVTNSDGVKQATPQAILDKLVGKLTFDPLAFARENPKQQADTLRQLVGVDVSAMDAERQKTFDDRTAVNREMRSLETRMAAMKKHDGVPETETSTASILEEQQKAAAVNADNQKLRRVFADAQAQAKIAGTNLANTRAEIERLKALEKKQIATDKTTTDAVRVAEEAAANLSDVPLCPFQQKAADAESVNVKVRENAARAVIVKQYKAKVEESNKLTSKIEDIDGKKRKAIMEAKFPIDGLSFDTAGGVSLNGIPFEQTSSADQLKVSVAIGIALNPKLRVLLIRDGSLLDDESLKVLIEMAAKADAQVWLERVGTDAATSVVIEDGQIAPASPAQA